MPGSRLPLITAPIRWGASTAGGLSATGGPGNNLILRSYAGIGPVQPSGASTVAVPMTRVRGRWAHGSVQTDGDKAIDARRDDGARTT